MRYDVIIIGTGSMGSAAMYFLAKRGVKVLGLERFDIVHENGSHTGQSRLIRKAYFEHQDYVPLLQRAYDLWHEVQAETNKKLYYQTGIAYFGKHSSVIMEGSRKSAQRYNIPIIEHPTADYSSRLGFTIPNAYDCFFEPEAGFLLPDQAIRTYCNRAIQQGAKIITNTKVIDWKTDQDHVTVRTSSGTFYAAKLIITSGSWTSKLVPTLTSKLKVTKQTLAWAELKDPQPFMLNNFPCWFVDDPEKGLYYGFPVLPSDHFKGPSGLKLALHVPGNVIDPDTIDGPVSNEDESAIKFFFDKYLPGIPYTKLTFKHCLYTNAPDSNFIIDHLPDTDKLVTIACGFSGHGFKFVPVIGEILADLALEGKTQLPIGFLKIARVA